MRTARLTDIFKKMVKKIICILCVFILIIWAMIIFCRLFTVVFANLIWSKFREVSAERGAHHELLQSGRLYELM